MTTARLTRIDFDEEENPQAVNVALSDDVLERLRADYDIPLSLPQGRPDGLFDVTMTMGMAADIARYLGGLPGLDKAGSAFYYCVSGLCNCWWEDGVAEAPSVGTQRVATAT